MRCEPPPVKRHTRGRPSNLLLPLSKESSRPRGQKDKNRKRPVKQSQRMYIPWFPHVRPGLAAFLLLPLWRSFIMPSHTERGGAQLMYLCCTAASWNRHGGHCIISWFFYAQNTSSALTSSQLLYLISTELIYCESPGLYHRYNQVHVYKISYRTQCLKWNIQRIARVYSTDCFNGRRVCPLEAFIKSCFAYFRI